MNTRGRTILKLGVIFSIIAGLTAALIIGNKYAFRFSDAITSELSPAIVDKEEVASSNAKGKKMSEEIMRQGTVLLKNDGNTLPLDLSTSPKVNVFGWHSVEWIYGSIGGTASGIVQPEDGVWDNMVDLYDALDEHGVLYNEKLRNMYLDYATPINSKPATMAEMTILKEPDIEDRNYYSAELMDYTRNFSDTAIVVLSRMAGEGMECSKSLQRKQDAKGVVTEDTTRHYLEISTEEEALLKYVAGKDENGKARFEKVIVLLNMCNAFECGFLDTIEGIDACLYVGYTGTKGATAIPELLYGDTSPSGRTVDTFAYDLFTNPANYAGFGAKTFSNKNWSYVDYLEGIYVGYKWYETADAMKVWSAENGYPNGYDSVVQFPFGYGLSYTTFDWKVDDIKILDGTGEEAVATSVNPVKDKVSLSDKDKVEFTVSVTNTGNVAGREVIELYVTPPYTAGGVEKSYVSLVGYAKTDVIPAGESQTVTVTADLYDVASYDCYNLSGAVGSDGGYVLEDGEYFFKLMTDSHHVKNVTYKDESASASFGFRVDQDIPIQNDPVTGEAVSNKFTGKDSLDRLPLDGRSNTDSSYDPDIPWFKRSEFVKPADFSTLAKPAREIAPEGVSHTWDSPERWTEWENATADFFGAPVDTSPVKWGEKNGLKAFDGDTVTELGKRLAKEENYDSEEWTKLLSQLNLQETLDNMGMYYGSAALESVGKPKLSDLDGPAQIKSVVSAPRGTGYPAMVVIAATFNEKLHYDFGKSFGDDMTTLKIDGLWGWAVDSHRDNFFGRCYESPSEDPFLAGKTIAKAVKGLHTRGKYCFIKHFAVYTYNSPDNTYMTEQALREVYLKAFRPAFVESKALGVMSSFQGLGGESAEVNAGMLVGVLRKEWQFKGAMTTDYISGGEGLCDGMLRLTGSYAMGCQYGKKGFSYSETSSPVRVQHAVQEAMKHILYARLHAYELGEQYKAKPDATETLMTSAINSWVWWKPLLYSVDIVFGAILLLWAAFLLEDTFMKDSRKKGVEEAEGTRRKKELTSDIVFGKIQKVGKEDTQGGKHE